MSEYQRGAGVDGASESGSSREVQGQDGASEAMRGHWRPEAGAPADQTGAPQGGVGGQWDGATSRGHDSAPHQGATMHQGGYGGYAPPPPGMYPPPGMHQGYAYGAAPGAGNAPGPRVSDLMEEVASGGNGLSTLSRMLNFDDPDFWKGALVGAAAVLLLTSDSVQQALFKSGNGKENDNRPESGK